MYTFDEKNILGINPDGTAVVDIRDILASPKYSPRLPGESIAFPDMVPPANAALPQPKSDISAVPQDAYQDFDAQRAADPRNQVPIGDDQAAYSPAAAQATVGEQAKTKVLQPGNRRSIKEYLAEIKKLREQLRAQGVPEDQLPVPSFTNIQGGEMDKSQGYLEAGPGGMGQQEVRSYVNPEWKQSATGGAPTEMGPTHPIQQQLDRIKANSPSIQNLKGVLGNDMDPRWAMSVAFDVIDDWMKQEYDKTGSMPTPKEVDRALNGFVNQAFKDQGEQLAKYQKMFPGKTMEDFWRAFKTGNWGEVSNKAGEMMSQEKVGKVMDEARQRWDKMRDQDNAAPLDDDGNPFQNQESYVRYKVQQYQELISKIYNAAQGQISAGGPQTKKGSTGGPQSKPTGPAPGAKVVNEGTMPDGRRVKQYSDGSIYDEKGNRIK